MAALIHLDALGCFRSFVLRRKHVCKDVGQKMSTLRMYRKGYRCLISAILHGRSEGYGSKRFVSVTSILDNSEVHTNGDGTGKTNPEHEIEVDYFGIEGDAGAESQSYQPLNVYLKAKLEAPSERIEDKLVKTKYGFIRYDIAKPKGIDKTISHNTIELSSEQKPIITYREKKRQLRKLNKQKLKESYIDEQYFGYKGSFAENQDEKLTDDLSPYPKTVHTPIHDETLETHASLTEEDIHDNFVDKQHFQYDGNMGKIASTNKVCSSDHLIDSSKSYRSDDYLNEIDNQYFGDEVYRKDHQAFKDLNDFETLPRLRPNVANNEPDPDDLNEVDSQYFSSHQETNNAKLQTNVSKPDCFDTSTTHTPLSSNFESGPEDFNEIDSQYFVSNQASTMTKRKTSTTKFKAFKTSRSRSPASNIALDPDNFKEIDLQYFAKEEMEYEDQLEEEISGKNIEEFHWKTFEKKKRLGKAFTREVKEESIEGTALEAALKLRRDLERRGLKNLHGVMNPHEYDSKGFRILTNQVPHFDNAMRSDVVKVLRSNVVYDERDIVAINKPYNMPSQDGPKEFHSITKYLDSIIPGTTLHTIHRLDKETTGVMLFAKTEAMANALRSKFHQREVIKRYYAITKNIPHTPTGEIDIPIRERVIDGRERMVLQPYMTADLKEVMKDRQTGQDAVTRYRVLDRGDRCALVECIPTTGKKHQIRVHLAMGLDCPILGDHKYSHVNKYAPQRLHPSMLKHLKIRQPKVRHLAMHLHAYSVTIPGFLDGRNFHVSAPLPPHFRKNLRELNLKFGSNTRLY